MTPIVYELQLYLNMTAFVLKLVIFMYLFTTCAFTCSSEIFHLLVENMKRFCLCIGVLIWHPGYKNSYAWLDFWYILSWSDYKLYTVI